MAQLEAQYSRDEITTYLKLYNLIAAVIRTLHTLFLGSGSVSKMQPPPPPPLKQQPWTKRAG